MATNGKWFLVGFLVLVAAEIAAFTFVSSAIGLPQAFLLLAAMCFVGVAVLRQPGRTTIAQMHKGVEKGGIGGLEAGGDAFLTVAAGVLLLVPGFLTDIAGLSLLLPPVRRWIGGRFQGFVQTQTRQPGVVDLEPDQWNQVPDRQIDDQRRP